MIARTDARKQPQPIALEWQGRTWSVRELAAAHGLKRDTLQWRLQQGWSMEKALAKPRPCGRNPVARAEAADTAATLATVAPPRPQLVRQGFPQLRALLQECEDVLRATRPSDDRRRELLDKLKLWKARC